MNHCQRGKKGGVERGFLDDIFDENETDLETMIHGIDLDVFFFSV